MRFRFFLLIGGTTLSFLFLAFHLYTLQVNNGTHYRQLAQAQNAGSALLQPRRGSIYMTDKAGGVVPVAIVKEYESVFATPKFIEDPDLIAGELGRILDLDAASLVARLSKKESEYELIAARPTETQIKMLKDLGLQGVHFETRSARFYPFDSLAAHVIGFVGLSGESEVPAGKYGIEAYYNTALTGTAGMQENGKLTPPVAGRDIVLTLEREVQTRAEEILEPLVKQYRAVEGTIMVSDPKTGRLLAMASYPTFNPNEYQKSELSHLKNPAVQSIYEPGSVFKIITMAAGLDSGAITPQTTYTDTGSVTLNGRTIKNWDLKAHGTLTMTNVIENSVNTGTIFAERKTGHDAFYDYLLKFGFKQPTGITLPGEVIGSLSPLEKNTRDINFATASFGQGVATTPLRMLAATAAIANDGVLIEPYILEEERSGEQERVISPEAARQVSEMMVSAVKKNVVADIKNYDVAGKTGTAFIPGKGGYTDEVINTYVGFAPAFDPRFVILVKLDRPEGAPLAGQTVVPAFRELAEFLLNYYHIPPSHIEGE